MASTPVSRDRYAIRAVLHACDVLAAFRFEGESLRLGDVVARTALPKATAFRLLCTLELRGLVVRLSEQRFRLTIKPVARPRFKFGYAAEGPEFRFSHEVTESIKRAADAQSLELVVLDNRYNARTAIRNAELLVRERVDLAVVFQADEQAAPIVASSFLDANIPLIAVEIPHPGAVYYGANNYEAGLIGGRYLGRWAQKHWQGTFDEVVLLELPMAGSVPRARLTGTVVGIREHIRELDESSVIYLDGAGRFGKSLEAVRRHLRRTQAKRILVSGINDPSVLGALRAFAEAGRLQQAVFVGQNASPEARAELREPGTRFIASVGYFGERYGEGIVPLALDILAGKRVPPAVFVKHRLITPETADHYYPNDVFAEAVRV